MNTTYTVAYLIPKYCSACCHLYCLFFNTDIESALLLKVPCIYRIAMMGEVFKGAGGSWMMQLPFAH